MSWLEATDPECVTVDRCDPVIDTVVPRAKDLGEFEVRRVLPARRHQMIGPFIFFDHIGPAAFAPGKGIDVRPHPHIGLSTVTWLLSGEIHHRDSLGSDQVIRPGEVNWMTAGCGIVHSERTPHERRARGQTLHGLQVWCALPREHEETTPEFHHHGADALPSDEGEGVRLVMVVGNGFGLRSPVRTYSETVYADAALAPKATLSIPSEHEERGVYVTSGAIAIDGQRFGDGSMLVLRPGHRVDLTALESARVMVVGGASMDGPRHIWWNFVSSSKERIESAKDDWRERRFASVPGDEQEFIPLPG